jgi:hypothetical protein
MLQRCDRPCMDCKCDLRIISECVCLLAPHSLKHASEAGQMMNRMRDTAHEPWAERGEPKNATSPSESPVISPARSCFDQATRCPGWWPFVSAARVHRLGLGPLLSKAGPGLLGVSGCIRYHAAFRCCHDRFCHRNVCQRLIGCTRCCRSEWYVNSACGSPVMRHPARVTTARVRVWC